MDDGVCASRIEFKRVLHKSFKHWYSYRKAADASSLLPRHSIDLTSLLGCVPAYLACGLPLDYGKFSLTVRETTSKGEGCLLTTGHSIWKTSKGDCNTEPKVISSQLLLAVPKPVKILFSDEAPMAAWPGVQGMSGSGRMNHITPLFLAWAYILSAKWLELLKHSSGHSCKLQYSESTSAQITSKLDIGYEIDASENRWWNAVLSLGWKMTTNYEGRVYLSPWSVTASDSPFQGEEFQTIASNAASSQTALTYLNRFSMQHDLQDQYAAALAAALFIPSLGGSTLLLPRLAIPSRPRGSTRGCSGSFSDQGEFLPYYMTLSCIPFGMRSLLCSTFFNADIKCNLVSAWLGPCFAMIDPLIKDGDFTKLAALLGYRQPSVAALWVGAIIVGMAKSVIREMRIGLGALDLHAAAWTSTLQSFINVNPGKAEETTILREDECRLLFILGSGSHSRLPLFPWKPFGTTPLEEAEIEIKIHAKCNCHCLEHLSWHWELSNGTTLEDTGLNRTWKEKCDVDIGLNDCPKTYTIDQSELVSEISEIATRGIFGWLRPHGYPASESFIHEHPWFDIGSSEEEEADSDSDEEKDQQSINVRIENWMAEASIFDRKWR